MTLREDIAMVLEDAYWLGSDAARGRREAESSMLIARGYTDRIMALIAEAMLSDEAVDAHLTRTWGWYDYDKGLWYDDAPEDVKEGARDDARHGVEGALAAAGVTDAGQEGGERE